MNSSKGDTNMEEFRDIPNWEGIFQVSNYGRVKNVLTNNILRGSVSELGYISVTLTHKGRYQTWRLNRLVATVWERPLLSTEDAHHKNKFRFCNCIYNLYIIDGSQHQSKHFKGRVFSEQHRMKLSNAAKGKKKSLQHRKHMSEAMKRKYQQKKRKEEF